MQLRRITFLVSMLILIADAGCNKCNMLFFQEAWGNWALVQLDSPSKTQTVFPVKQMLKIALENDRSGNTFTGETLFTNNVNVDNKQWESFDPDCRNSSLTAIYNKTFRRKYWLSERNQRLRATGYVDQIGGKADTLIYYYTRVQ
ncbi:hypothetical protein [Spirosoma utsteinense]|uniref:Lipocalin-like domain-containing protein n=1 Tax=Spirosoma utsteinense TaxID=2585773 RepID=A0ABR6WBU0_9BACT|nr:hypothetical protein [Spirosoma utsteinense]MBC3789335.1 hypothetical protein [Spirosoma utsteinense]MBC3794030.1 hypothetical protein [Spirosoma utsteinense]